MASIPDAETCDFLKPLITGGTWVGGYKTHDTWMWTDGTPFNFSNWYNGKPDNGVNIRIGTNGGSEVKFFADASHRTWPGLCQFRFSYQYQDGTGTGTGMELDLNSLEEEGGQENQGICGVGQGSCCAGSNDGCPPEAPICSEYGYCQCSSYQPGGPECGPGFGDVNGGKGQEGGQISGGQRNGGQVCGMGQGACCAGSNDGCPPKAHKVKLKNIFRL